MKSFNYTITDPIGIHARPASLLVKTAQLFKSNLTIEKEGKSAGLTKLMAIMQLGIKSGDLITVTAEGADEETAIAELEKFFKNNL